MHKLGDTVRIASATLAPQHAALAQQRVKGTIAQVRGHNGKPVYLVRLPSGLGAGPFTVSDLKPA